MLKFLKNKRTPIGLDIGHSSIKMIQMVQSEGQLSVHAADRAVFGLDLDDKQRQEFAIKTIKDMVQNGNFHGHDAIVSISNKDLKLKNLRVDSIEEKELKKLIHDEVASQLGLDPEKDEIRYLVAGKVHHGGELKNEVIFMGTDRKTIESYIDLLAQAGVTPVAIDPVPHALQRSFTRSLRRQSDQAQVNFYIDIGSAYTTVLIGSNQQINFIKHISIAGDKFNSEVATKLDVSIDEAKMLRSKLQHSRMETVNFATKQAITDAMIQTIEELAREVSLCFRYYAVTFRGIRPEHVVLAGGEAYEEALSIALKNELNMEMEIANPLKGLDLSRIGKIMDPQSPLCEWSVATGLSLKGFNSIQHRQGKHERN